MKKIFMDIMEYTDPDGYYDFEFLFKDAMKYFVDLYYRKYKEIRGKDIINLIDLNEISKKINEISGLDKYNDLYINLSKTIVASAIFVFKSPY